MTVLRRPFADARRRMAITLMVIGVPSLGCAAPIPLTDARFLRAIATRYAEFHQRGRDPDVARDADLLRPRFGLPLFARAGSPFAVEWLERGGPSEPRLFLSPRQRDRAAADRAVRCLDERPPAGCLPLAVKGVERLPIEGSAVARVVAQVAPDSSVPPAAGAYDLLFASGHDAPEVVPSTVWLRDDDPEGPRPLRVALISDLHIGKRVAHLEDHLLEVIDELNHRPLDLVVVTGDITNMGTKPQLAPRARAFLERVEAPVLVTIGNHDHGFGRKILFSDELGEGYLNFSRSFHPLLYYRLALAGWDLLGFDTGPSRPSPTINNRGLHPESLRRIAGDLDAAKAAHRRGALLLSHCASRASLSGRALTSHPGYFGHMAEGGPELERLELAAADGGLRVYHLAGHTHWSDLFEAHRDAAGHYRYQLFPEAPREGWRPIDSPAAIVTVQAATHPGLFVKESAHGYGYALLTLGTDRTEVFFVRHLETVRKAGKAPEEYRLAP